MSMPRGWFIRLFALLIFALPLVACGAKPADKSANATRTSAAQQVNDQDVASGCWSAADRVQSSVGGGNDTVAHQQWKQAPALKIDPAKTYKATLQTNKGNFEVEFFPKDAPLAINNFVCLAEAGYFDNTPFHRIVAGFVIQGGDPTGTGTGGPGYKFADEKVTREYTKGTLAMANAGPNTNGSQFFVCLGNVGLPKNYTIFGQVTSGQDVVDAIGKTPTKVGSSGENSTPTEPITLEKVTVAVS
jgi:cyclophilin family peptidyl-prolyl cis-trans isomerase